MTTRQVWDQNPLNIVWEDVPSTCNVGHQIDRTRIRNAGLDPILHLVATIRDDGSRSYCQISKTGGEGTFAHTLEWSETFEVGATLDVFLARDAPPAGTISVNIDFTGDVPAALGPTDEDMDYLYKSLGLRPRRKGWRRWLRVRR